MNQQEKDRIFDKFSFVPAIGPNFRVMTRDDFTVAIQEATAQARRQALDEAAVTAWSVGMGLHMREHDVREVGSKIAAAIRGLAAQEAGE